MQHVRVRAENGITYVGSSATLSRHHADCATVSVTLPTDKRLFTLLNKQRLSQQVTRKIAPFLTAAQHTVFTQLMDRSIGWGRAQCFTTAKNIAEGNGKDWEGCGVTERTVKRCIVALEAMGLISKHATRNRGTLFTINLTWEKDVPMLAIPKRLKDGANQPEKQDRVSLIAPRKRDTATHEIKTEEPPFPTVSPVEPEYSPEPVSGPEEVFENSSFRGEQSNTTARENLNDLIARTEQRTAKKREQNIQRAKQKGNPLAFETIWRHAVAMHFPEIVVAPAWTKAQHGIIMAIAKKWTQGGKLSDFTEFFEWCVVYWPAVMRQQFRWMTKQKPPMAPDFRFWSKFHEEFLNCYHSGKLSKWMRAADRSRLEFLKQRGKTHEEALYEIAKEQAKQDIRDEVNEKLNAVQVVERRIVQRQKLEKQQREATPAIHPKSQLALQAKGQLQPVANSLNNPDVDLDELERLAADLPEWNDDDTQ